MAPRKTSCRLPSQGRGSTGSLARVSSSADRLRFFFNAMMQQDGSSVTSAPVQSSFCNKGGGGVALEAGRQLQGEQAVEIVGQDWRGRNRP